MLEKLKNCKDPQERRAYELFIAKAQSNRWANYPFRTDVHFSEQDYITWQKHLSKLDSIVNEMVFDKGERSIGQKKERVFSEIKKLFEKKYGIKTIELTPKMRGLMKELSKYTGEKFDTPQQAMKYILEQEAKALYNL